MSDFNRATTNLGPGMSGTVRYYIGVCEVSAAEMRTHETLCAILKSLQAIEKQLAATIRGEGETVEG